jgi:signal peptidase I
MTLIRRGRLLLLTLVFGLAAYTLLATHGLAPPPPEFSRFSLLTVRSGSMSPVMATHSLIVVDKKQILPLSTGDIITFHACRRQAHHPPYRGRGL